MIKLRLFKEQWPGTPSFVAPVLSMRDKLGVEHRDVVLRYLRSASIVIEWFSPVKDPLDGTLWSNELWTDGDFIWDSIVMHWVRRYNVPVLNILLKKAIATNGECKPVTDPALREYVSNNQHGDETLFFHAR